MLKYRVVMGLSLKATKTAKIRSENNKNSRRGTNRSCLRRVQTFKEHPA